jgi:hypothetical protein
VFTASPSGKPPFPRWPTKPPEQTPTEKIAALDAELRVAGIQKTPQAPRAPDGKFVAKPTVADVDACFIDALNKAYRALSPAEREVKRAQYQTELQKATKVAGSGEARGNFLGRTADNPGSDKPVASATPAQMNFAAAYYAATKTADAKGTIAHTLLLAAFLRIGLASGFDPGLPVARVRFLAIQHH